MYKINVETYDWICEQSAEKAKIAMEHIISSLTPEDTRRWAEAWLRFEDGEDVDDDYLYHQEISDACNQAELIGLEGWASEPSTGHSVTIQVDKLT